MSGTLGGLLKLVLIPALGAALVKSGLLTKQGSGALVAVLINIGYPAMVLTNMWRMDLSAMWKESAAVVMISSAAAVVFFFLGRLFYSRRNPEYAALWAFMLGVGNIVYAGIPVLELLGGAAAVTTAIIYSSVVDFYIWSMYYPSVLAKKGGVTRNVLLNPCILAFAAGLTLSVFHVPFPDMLEPTLDSVTGLVSPLALLYVGATIAQMDIRAAFCSRQALTLAFIKVVLVPAICFFVLQFLLPFAQAVFLAVIIACPTTVLSLVWSQSLKNGEQDAANCFITSTAVFFLMAVPLLAIF